MVQLLTTYPLGEILSLIVILALAIKGVVSFWDWAYERLKKIFKKENQQETDREKIDKLIQQQAELNEKIKTLTTKINILVDSDKDDIKSFITDKHHYFVYEKKWIDDHSLDCIEKRYKHYTDEGGNSFIATLMSEVRALPKQSLSP